MNKKIVYFIICLFLYSCGFQPMLKNFDISNLNIKQINYSGKKEIEYLIKNYLNIKETNNEKGISVNLSFLEKNEFITKNSSGVTTEENLTIIIDINVIDSMQNILLQDQISASKRLNVSNNLSSDEEARRIERDNLIFNLSQKIKFKLQVALKNYK